MGLQHTKPTKGDQPRFERGREGMEPEACESATGRGTYGAPALATLPHCPARRHSGEEGTQGTGRVMTAPAARNDQRRERHQGCCPVHVWRHVSRHPSRSWAHHRNTPSRAMRCSRFTRWRTLSRAHSLVSTAARVCECHAAASAPSLSREGLGGFFLSSFCICRSTVDVEDRRVGDRAARRHANQNTKSASGCPSIAIGETRQ